MSEHYAVEYRLAETGEYRYTQKRYKCSCGGPWPCGEDITGSPALGNDGEPLGGMIVVPDTGKWIVRDGVGRQVSHDSVRHFLDADGDITCLRPDVPDTGTYLVVDGVVHKVEVTFEVGAYEGLPAMWEVSER